MPSVLSKLSLFATGVAALSLRSANKGIPEVSGDDYNVPPEYETFDFHVPDACKSAIAASTTCSVNPLVTSCLEADMKACKEIDNGPPASVMTDCADPAILAACDPNMDDMDADSMDAADDYEEYDDAADAIYEHADAHAAHKEKLKEMYPYYEHDVTTGPTMAPPVDADQDGLEDSNDPMVKAATADDVDADGMMDATEDPAEVGTVGDSDGDAVPDVEDGSVEAAEGAPSSIAVPMGAPAGAPASAPAPPPPAVMFSKVGAIQKEDDDTVPATEPVDPALETADAPAMPEYDDDMTNEKDGAEMEMPPQYPGHYPMYDSPYDADNAPDYPMYGPQPHHQQQHQHHYDPQPHMHHQQQHHPHYDPYDVHPEGDWDGDRIPDEDDVNDYQPYDPSFDSEHIPADCEASVKASPTCSTNPIVMACLAGNMHSCEEIENGPPASVIADCPGEEISAACSSPNGDMEDLDADKEMPGAYGPGAMGEKDGELEGPMSADSIPDDEDFDGDDHMESDMPHDMGPHHYDPAYPEYAPHYPEGTYPPHHMYPHQGHYDDPQDADHMPEHYEPYYAGHGDVDQAPHYPEGTYDPSMYHTYEDPTDADHMPEYMEPHYHDDPADADTMPEALEHAPAAPVAPVAPAAPVAPSAPVAPAAPAAPVAPAAGPAPALMEFKSMNGKFLSRK